MVNPSPRPWGRRCTNLEQTSFSNEWFSTWCDQADKLDESYCRPKALTTSPHAVEWTDLESENVPYTVHDIMTDNQSEEIEKELGVSFTSALGGRLVYISGNNEESIAKAQKKLGVMLAIRVSRRKQVSADRECTHLCVLEIATWLVADQECVVRRRLRGALRAQLHC